jgi:hypothetical protein
VVVGQAVTVAFAGASDPSAADTAAGFRYSYDFDNDGVFEIAGSASASQQGTFTSAGAHVVRGRIADKDGGFTDYTTTVQVQDTGVTATITSPDVGQVFQIGDSVKLRGQFTAPADVTGFRAEWTLNATTLAAPITLPGTVTGGDGVGKVRATFNPTTAGVYDVTLTVYDRNGAIVSRVTDKGRFVVADPNAGWASASGAIASPAGAYPSDPSVEGRLSFQVVARYPHGQTVPTGYVDFRLRRAHLHFHGTKLDWLVVAGSHIQLHGSGRLNGRAGYEFLVTAFDGRDSDGPDRLRLKIWDPRTGRVVYDSEAGRAEDADPVTELVRGKVKVHPEHHRPFESAPRGEEASGQTPDDGESSAGGSDHSESSDRVVPRRLLAKAVDWLFSFGWDG